MSTRDHKAVDLSSSALAEAASATGARACASLQSGATWQQATDAVCETLSVSDPDLAVVFVDSQFAHHYEDVLRRIREATGAQHLIGCSGHGVIGPGREAEGQAAVSAMTFRLPGVSLTPLALVQDTYGNDLLDSLEAADAKAWMVFADPGATHICTAPGFLDTSLAVITRPLRCSARAPGGRLPGCGGRGARPARPGCSGL